MEETGPQGERPRFDAASVAALLHSGDGQSPALCAPGRQPLSYAELRYHVAHTVAAINALGIGVGDRVAMVLGNGPEAACAFLALAAGATVAPLNPAYRHDDFRFFFACLRVRAVLVQGAGASPAAEVAREMGLPLLELFSSREDPAGLFSIKGAAVGPPRPGEKARASDTALLLHTSGTTSRPKTVPLSHGNLAASARHIVETLCLTPGDRCLNVMPLFHIHGLVAGLLAPLSAGGTVFCPPGFNARGFFGWMAEANPTWYTAVPAMHQSVVDHAQANRGVVDQARLRFIRSSSAALPVRLMGELEQLFNAPVIESYGMTEAAHQMASNPLPPAVRKPGTVGPAAGPEVAIMGTDLRLLGRGQTGEVVIRGANVAPGYENDPAANAAAFAGGWFHTGDEGVLDEDGYLRITGRLKEFINRGGEKISPSEIDAALMAHPGVAAATAFPVPHPTLGEDVAAAVVAASGAALNERQLASHLSSRLAAFKIPRRFVLVNDIPKGATGKVRRRDLAAALNVGPLGDELRSASRAGDRPSTPLEEKLKPLWKEILGLQAVGIHENFFLLGGDSLRGVELLARVEKTIGCSLPQSVLIEAATIAAMAARIESQAPSACVVPIQPNGSRPPFFCVHHVEGEVLPMRNLARYLGEDQPFYGIQAVGIDGTRPAHTRIEDMAAHYIREMRKYQAAGPYHLGGYSMGGIVAYEMTRQLKAQGEQVALLALLDTYAGPRRRRLILSRWLRRHWRRLAELRPNELAGYLNERLLNWRREAAESLRRVLLAAKWRAYRIAGGTAPGTRKRQSVTEANEMALWAYRMTPCELDAVLFKGELSTWDDPQMHDGWESFVQGNLEIRTVSGAHSNIMGEPHARKLAAELADCLQQRHGRAA